LQKDTASEREFWKNTANLSGTESEFSCKVAYQRCLSLREQSLHQSDCARPNSGSHDKDVRTVPPVLVMGEGMVHDSFQASADRVQLASADSTFLLAGVNRSPTVSDPVSEDQGSDGSLSGQLSRKAHLRPSTCGSGGVNVRDRPRQCSIGCERCANRRHSCDRLRHRTPHRRCALRQSQTVL
jgi:hypothetical protein